MERRSMLSWFEKRRQTITLNLAQNQILKVIDTVAELERAITAFSENEVSEAAKCIERLFISEIEIDKLRRAVFIELTKGSLPPKYREDLKALIGRLDRLADYVKDAARSVKILVQSKSSVPKDFLVIFGRMANNLAQCTKHLQDSIEALGNNTSQAIEYASKVDNVEEQIDEDHLLVKISFITNAATVDAPIFLILKDLADSLEQAADMCADTADFIMVLAAGEG
jgi:predicted phosphate transport protein (TIGR00153 family)